MKPTSIKLLALLSGLCLSFMTFSAYAQSAQVSLSMQDASLEQVMKEVEKQTGYLLVYHDNIDLRPTGFSLVVANRFYLPHGVYHQVRRPGINLHPI